jgi:hypothetical protein
MKIIRLLGVTLFLLVTLSGNALAVTTFEVSVEWLNNDPTPEDLVLTVITYSDASRQEQEEQFVMDYIATNSNVSIFKVTRSQILPESIYWSVSVSNENPETELVENNPAQDQDQISVDNENNLWIHMQDIP